MKKKNILFRRSFLFIVVMAYLITGFFDTDIPVKAAKLSLGTLIRLIPVFLLVLFFMALFDYFINILEVAKKINKTSGVKRYLIAMIGGLISSGPVYMWYPLLKEMRDKGIGCDSIAVFIYCRSIKPPLIPIMIFYFGLKYTIILSFVIAIMSIIQGIIMMELEKINVL